MENNLEIVTVDTEFESSQGTTYTEVKEPADEPRFLDFVTIDVWTLIFTWGNLLILFLLMKKLLFKPVRKMMLDRENEVKEMYFDAEKSRSDADALKADYETRLSSAKQEAEEIIKSATRSATLKSEEIIADAQKNAAGIIERADKQIEAEKRNAENELKNEVSDLALSIASKVIEKEIDGDKHKELIDSFIEKMGEV
ncbi:MAG: F0F1 ATP synthase subunit B [Clostridia bacterium]|nr:F0F1 ATP synthase subunit B [Clostridia bacterium]